MPRLRIDTVLPAGLLALAACLISGCGESTAPAAPTASGGPTNAADEVTPPAAAAASEPADDRTTSPRPAFTAAPPSAPPSAPPPAASQPSGEDDPLVAKFLGFAAPKPAAWQWAPPKSAMRAVNYIVPGESGGEQADLIVFRGIGGGRDANIKRWQEQFRSADQQAAEPIVEDMEIDGIPVTTVELRGERMNMGEQWFTKDQVFLAAIILAPEGDVFVTLSGQSATVDANRDAFAEMISGLRRE